MPQSHSDGDTVSLFPTHSLVTAAPLLTGFQRYQEENLPAEKEQKKGQSLLLFYIFIFFCEHK